MTYGRSRLWLGITAVGSLVCFAAIALALDLPEKWLESQPGLGKTSFIQLLAVTGIVTAWLTPFDLLGGFVLPISFHKSVKPISLLLRNYVVGILLQGLLFVAFGSLIIAVGHEFGIVGALILVSLFAMVCLIIRDKVIRYRALKPNSLSEKLLNATSMAERWETSIPRILVVDHDDEGFTGGIIGFGKNCEIILPRAWLFFETEQLAIAIARRAIAVNNGTYTRGLVFAFFWNLVGFGLSYMLPGASVANVAGFVTLLCGFTLWSFLGLLTLPTISRKASSMVDTKLVEKEVSFDLIMRTASSMDRLQDDEPERPTFVETIFHPVPSVRRRKQHQVVKGLVAWNVARTALFFSWSCLGFLSRSVHCNIGRPDLWLMLPTD